jgi:hypothetical protein
MDEKGFLADEMGEGVDKMGEGLVAVISARS